MTDPSPDAPRAPLPGPSPHARARSSGLRKWGPLGAILVVVALVAGLTLTGGGDDAGDEETAAGGGSSTTLDAAVLAGPGFIVRLSR